jgi:acetyltransferase-like isoleucine patch superfamily enzyme
VRLLLNKIITQIKGENYILDENIKLSSVFLFLQERVGMLLRGIVKFPLASAKHRIFLGRRVAIIGYKNIHFHGSFTLNEYCQINSISSNVNFVGTNFSLGSNCKLICTSVLSQLGRGFEFGDNVGINSFCFLGAQGGLKIGSDTIIGPYTSIFTENHDYKGVEPKIRKNPSVRKSVEVGQNCWIGAKVIILPGSRIGNNCVVAAGAIVRGNVPEDSIYFNFDKIIKK